MFSRFPARSTIVLLILLIFILPILAQEATPNSNSAWA